MNTQGCTCLTMTAPTRLKQHTGQQLARPAGNVLIDNDTCVSTSRENHCNRFDYFKDANCMKSKLLIALLAAMLGACASVPLGDESRDEQLKTFPAVSQDKAGLYIYRNESMGASVKMEVDIDGQQVGTTARKTYLYKEVTPGKHTITSHAENTDTLEVDLQPGTLAYVWQEVKMGILFARSKLHLVPEEQGKAGVLESTLVETR